ncbi:hypothetical protein RFI_28668, partial [Reticulomyxa filosa]
MESQTKQKRKHGPCNETQEHNNKKKLTKSQGWIGKKSCTQKNLCKSLSHKQRMSIITIIFILKIFSLNPDQFFFFSFFSHSLLCPSSSKRKKRQPKKKIKQRRKKIRTTHKQKKKKKKLMNQTRQAENNK